MTFLVQTFWWLLPINRDRMGFSRHGFYSAQRQRVHARARRRYTVGLLTGGTYFPNIIHLHAFWLNERCPDIRFVLDPEPEAADALWVYSQDPLTAAARERIDRALDRARLGALVINRPDAYDFFHREDAFALLDEAGVTVARSRFDDSDLGLPVVWKGAGTQSSTFGPEPYAGPRKDHRCFEFIDTRGDDGLYARYRIFYFLGDIFYGSLFRSATPIVRYDNAVVIDRHWSMQDELFRSVESIARTSGLDFFAADFVRRHDQGPPIFTDINVFPMLKDKDTMPRRFGYSHDFDNLRPATGRRTPWQVLEDAVGAAAGQR
jgi:hypothetical protein